MLPEGFVDLDIHGNDNTTAFYQRVPFSSIPAVGTEIQYFARSRKVGAMVKSVRVDYDPNFIPCYARIIVEE